MESKIITAQLKSACEMYKSVYEMTLKLGTEPLFEALELVLELREGIIAKASSTMACLDANSPLWRTCKDSTVQVLVSAMHDYAKKTELLDETLAQLLQERKKVVRQKLAELNPSMRAHRGYITAKSMTFVH